MKEIELVEKRGKREKHFLQGDGTIIAKMYDEDIHFVKNGKFEEIDNSLELKDGYYHNKNNSYKVAFCKDSKLDLVTMQSNNHFLTMNLKNNGSLLKEKGNKSNKLISEIKYENILDEIDLDYKVLPNKVKESIILKNKNFIKQKIKFEVETDLLLKLNEDKSISAIFGDEVIFIIEAPYMIDSNNDTNHNIYYELKNNNKKYELILNLDIKWLSDETRKYPIFVDPTITNTGTGTSVYDTYIYSGDTNVDRNSQDQLKAGVENVNGKNVVNRALLKFELPKIGTGSQIVAANLNLVGYPIDDYYARFYQFKMVAHQVTVDWTEQNANWAQMNNKYNNKVESCFWGTRSYMDPFTYNVEPSISSADITNIVKKWYSNTPNYGILVKQAEENVIEDYVPIFFSKNNSVTGDNPKPFLEIQYRNHNGVINYINYKEQQFKSGIVYANTFNGNLVSIFSIGKTIGSRLPISISTVYNTNDVVLNKNIGYGLGWRLNYAQTVKEVIIEDINYLEYTDSDGTIHYFTEIDGVYKDEDGLNMTILHENNIYTLTDNNGHISKFKIVNGIGYLTEYINTENQKITINYNENNLISKIIDSNQKIINIYYDTNKITIQTPTETNYLNFLNNKLINIEKRQGTTIFDYNNQNIISQIFDETGKSIKYEYYEQIPYRLKKIIEFGLNDSEGKSLTFSYDFNTTNIVDNKNRINKLVFNNLGTLTSNCYLPTSSQLKDAYGNQIYYGDSLQYLNKLLLSGQPIKYINNYLYNTSFEDEQIYFTKSTNVIMSLTNETSFDGLKCLKAISNVFNEYISYEVEVPKGNDYTFSTYIKNTNKAKIQLSYIDVEGQTIVKESEIIETNNEFSRYNVCIHYPENATNNLLIKIIFVESGTIYIDNIQLEEGVTANYYNLLENSNFYRGKDKWGIEDDNHYNIVDIGDSNKALKITMEPSYGTSIYKTINMSGKKDDVIYLMFWYKNEGINGYYNMNSVVFNFGYIDLEYGSGSPIVDLDGGNDEWRFFIAQFTAKANYEGISFHLMQDFDANDLYLTNFCLFKDVRTNYYDYDETGKLTSTQSLSNEITKYTYDHYNQLVKVENSLSKSMCLEYDNNVIDRRISSISPEGISNETKYDNFGNVILTRKVNKSIAKEVENGIYKIRVKGTDKYLINVVNSIFVREDECNHGLWLFEKIDNYFRIKNLILDNKFLSVVNNSLILTESLDDSSLFMIIKNSNNSYLIKSKIGELYLKFVNNNIEVVQLEEDSNEFQFYIEKEYKLFLENKMEYEEGTNFLKRTEDPNFNVITYEFDQDTGLLKSTADAYGQPTYYEYYEDNKRIRCISNGDKEIYFSYNRNGLLYKIHKEEKEFEFIYDDFFNLKSIKVGHPIYSVEEDDFITFSTNQFEEKNGNLLAVTFGNNDIVQYAYDQLDKIIKITKMDKIYELLYDNNGNLVKIESETEKYDYVYDMAKRIQEYKFNDFKILYDYDSRDNVTKKKCILDSSVIDTTNTYNDDEAITKMVFNDNVIDYIYDELGRISEQKLNNNTLEKYNYLTNGNRTTMLLKDYYNNIDKYTYKYDKLNNITHIYENDKLIFSYEYNEYNEMILEKNYINRVETRYKYDDNGNILSKTLYEVDTDNYYEKIKYEYDNYIWIDRLFNYNGESIIYDEIGNPISIGDNINLTWINGKELNSYNAPNLSINYKYNKDGVRVSKIVNDIETNYYYEGKKLIFEKNGNNIISYIYDSLNNLIGFKYNELQYFYLKNGQEDIVGILDNNFNLIAKYNYDSWGNIISILDENGNDISNIESHIANKNPFRYRGYYYDIENKLYYLITRYYNPVWGRFINADITLAVSSNLKGDNLYSYALNNPVGFIDETGNWPKLLKNIGKSLKKVGQTIVNAAKTVLTGLFGGEITISGSQNIGYKPNISCSGVKFTGGTSIKYSGHIGDSDKPISASQTIGATIKNGIETFETTQKFNISRLNVSFNTSRDDNYLKVTWDNKDGTGDKGVSIGFSISNLSVFFSVHSEEEKEIGIGHETFGRTDVSLFTIAELALLPVLASSKITKLAGGADDIKDALNVIGAFGYAR